MQIRARFDLILVDPSSSDAVLNRVNTYLANHPAALVEMAPAAVIRHGSTSVVAELVYLDAQPARDLRDALVQTWTQGNLSSRIAVGSSVRWHVCRHDEGTGDCMGASGELIAK